MRFSSSRRFRYCLMQFQPAVAAQISYSEAEFLIFSQLFGLTDQIVHLFQNRLAVGIKVFSRRGEGKPPVLPTDQLAVHFLSIRHAQAVFPSCF